MSATTSLQLVHHHGNASNTKTREVSSSLQAITIPPKKTAPALFSSSNPKTSPSQQEQTLWNWNSQIREYSQSSCPQDSILFFYRLLCDEAAAFTPNHLTFPFLFNACRRLSAVKEGRQFHAHAIKLGLHADVFVQRALVRMYAKWGGCHDASELLDRCNEPDIVAQNDLISGYLRIGELESARKVFDGMKERNVVSWTIMIDGYAKNGTMDVARQLFDEMPERNQFSWTSLISGYLMCGNLEEALQIFSLMPERNIVAWTVMISGYVQKCLFKEALEMFLQMQEVGVDPNRITLASVLAAVAQLGELSQGRWIHAYIDRKGIELDGVLGSALVNMYSKCGCIEEALSVFDGLKSKELSAWNSILLGLATHGRGKDALRIFSKMEDDSSVIPNDVTFIGVLSACSHSGLVAEGQIIFDRMTIFYKLTPNIKHYGCMVDLLGRSGYIAEAKKFIENMPIKPNSVIWKTLLGACRIHKNFEMVEHILQVAVDSDPQDSGFYSIASNILVEAGRLDDAGDLRRQMNDLKVQKVAGCSWIEVDGEVHEFLTGRESFHIESKEIICMVDEMERLMRQEGYKTNAFKDSILVKHGEEDGEEASDRVARHSEKLAVAFGLIKTSYGTPIRVMKNLRVCSDCHSATKLISKIYNREIIMRDQNRFHHFKNGVCSCMDYW